MHLQREVNAKSMIMRLKTLSKLLLLLKGGDAPHLKFNTTNMIDVLCTWYIDDDVYDKIWLHASRRQRFRNDESNPRIKWMEEPSDDTQLNDCNSPYKIVMSWDCWWRCRKIFRYKWQNYIGWINLLRFRLYRWKLNYLDAIKFLNKHLRGVDFTNHRYRSYIYPLFK